MKTMIAAAAAAVLVSAAGAAQAAAPLYGFQLTASEARRAG